MKSAMTATGRYHPETEVPNAYFYEELGLDTTEEWILSRTGINTRRLADKEKGETAMTMALEASRQCLAKRGVAPEELDAVLVATVSPDQPLPSTASMLQDALGASRAWAFDLHAACSGFVYGLETAAALVDSGRARKVLLVGSDHMSSILDFTDRSSCIIFGDGAGAVLVEAVPDDHPGSIGRSLLFTDGSGGRFLQIPAGGGRMPITPQVLKEHQQYVQQDGKTVFKYAVTNICKVINQLLAEEGLTLDDIDLFVPHQANIRIIDAIQARLQVPKEKVVITVDRWANTTAATIPTSLDLAIEEGRVKKGDRLLFATFGAGFTWGAQTVVWGQD